MKETNHTSTVSMSETFEKLEARLIEANRNIDTTILKEILNSIKGTTITIGCGGSLVVANYLSKLLEERNIFSICRNSRDILHGGGKADSLFAFSYSGKTHGIHLALDHFIGNKYLITCNSNAKISSNPKIISFEHQGMNKEKSFVSLAATLIPIGEFLKIQDEIGKNEFETKIINYIHSSKKWLRSLANQNFLGYNSGEVFEIMTGYDTEVASTFLESTLTEAGLGNVIIHDKYSYCHGRSTISYLDGKAHNLIYLINEKTELDEFLLEQLKDTDYFPITIMDVSNSNTSSLERQYELLIKAVFLCKKIAEDKKMELSQVNYNKDIVHKVYYYKGEM